MRRAQGLEALVHDLVDATTCLVGEGHDSVARTVRRVAKRTPLGRPVAAVDSVRSVSTDLVLAAIRLTNRLVEAGADVAWRAAPDGGAPDPVPLRSDAIGTREGAIDGLIGALNGLVGDHLRLTGNPLDLGMSLRAVGEPSDRVVVFVHGLSATEWSWVINAGTRLGDPAAHYGSLLAADLGFSSLFARYNSGVPIARNGDALARAVDDALSRWPVPVRRVVLVGHSMGGLVAHAALRSPDARPWGDRVTDVVTLASPHGGAPLARFASAAAIALHALDLPASRIIGRIVAARSVGIQDLEGPLPAHAGPLRGIREHVFLATLTGDVDGPLGRWVGDGLVPPASAVGPEGAAPALRWFPGRNHIEIQVDREVYAALREALAT
jgi:pimeloyl-ACP methyl ester carboxylesterase